MTRVCKQSAWRLLPLVWCGWIGLVSAETKSNSLPPIHHRFADVGEEVPDFQRHVSPLLGRLGCNGRACHGSFQGQGGFRLSLFGYDFVKDLEALLDESSGRVDLNDPRESLILVKPTDADMHEGGVRYQPGSWEHHVLRSWIDGGAPSKPTQHLEKLVVSPAELIIREPQAPVSLRITAFWSDGTSEDVTPLCRFRSNDPGIAKIDQDGMVSTNEATGDTHVVVFYDKAVVPVPVIRPRERLQGDLQDWAAPTRIDQLVAKKLRKIGVRPSDLATDEMFLRRVSLDITGTLPTPEEVREFLSDPSADKRARRIEQLLESPAYAAWWTTFFCDLTGNNTDQLKNVTYDANKVSQQWYDWIHVRVKENVPYDELAEGIILATSRRPEEGYREYCERMSNSFHKKSESHQAGMPYYWMRREFQEGDTRAISFAHAFLGVRIQCAQCHKHPFDQWTQDDFQQFSSFFTGVKFTRNPPKADVRERAEILKELGYDPKAKINGKVRREIAQKLRGGAVVPFPQLVMQRPQKKRETPKDKKKKKGKRDHRDREIHEARLLGSNPIELADYEDVRKPVMEWLRSDDNPYFARALVNRVWARYFGIGIVEPADDFNLANPPSNGPLLSYLADGFVKNGYDLKWLHREIVNSRTYQLSWEPNESNRTDRRNFSHALPRRLPAEVVYDAIVHATSNQSRSESFQVKVGDRAIAIAGTNFRGGMKKKQKMNSQFALSVFGKSQRTSSCDCDRSDATSLIQTVYLKNDRDIHLLLSGENGWIRALVSASSLSEREQRRMKQTRRRLESFETRQKQLTANGDEERAEKMQAQIDRAAKELAALKQRADASKGEEPDTAELIKEAYLRTVSRYPSHDEVTRCAKHITEAKDLTDGLTGVLWALVNTKEFVVNH